MASKVTAPQARIQGENALNMRTADCCQGADFGEGVGRQRLVQLFAQHAATHAGSTTTKSRPRWVRPTRCGGGVSSWVAAKFTLFVGAGGEGTG